MFIDPTGMCLIDVLGLHELLQGILKFIESLVAGARLAALSAEAAKLKTNPTRLKYVDDNFTTYAQESDMSVIARMLYGEDHNSAKEHMWVLENRRIAGNYGGSDFRTLILAENQFSCMPANRSLDPASHFNEPGEMEAWYMCVKVAYLYTLYGLDSITLPYADFDYTYTHAYYDAIKEVYPNGERHGNTWFYNK